jgi:outer membrane receptor protein involved in Fe transport
MDASGDPTAKGFYYSQPQSNSTFGFGFPTTVGNPNLTPEKADTITAGFVFRAPSSDPMLSRLRLSVDYFDIKVKDAIGVQSIAVAQLQCFDPEFNPDIATNPAAAAANAFCQNITRNAQNGGLGDVKVTYVNNGRFRVRGIDGQLDWTGDIGPGALSVNVLASYLLDFKSAELPTRPLIEYAGSLGTATNGLNTGSAYKWKTFSTVNYRVGGFGVGMQWQHLPSVDSTSTAEGAPPALSSGAPSYDLFHMNLNYAFTDDINFRFGIENLFDKAPPRTGVNSANTQPAVDGLLPGGTLGAGLGGGLYDLNGRRYYFGVTAKF